MLSRKGAWIRTSVLGLVVGINFSCGCTPSRPSPPLDLTGTWSGTLGQPLSGTALRIAWTANQSGATVSGPATLTKPAPDVTFNGTLSGTLSGQTLSLTFTVPAGNVPGFASCSVSGTGTAGAATSTISGSLNLSYSSCEGFIQSSGNQPLSLTRP